jgi:hypothetical protein
MDRGRAHDPADFRVRLNRVELGGPCEQVRDRAASRRDDEAGTTPMGLDRLAIALHRRSRGPLLGQVGAERLTDFEHLGRE